LRPFLEVAPLRVLGTWLDIRQEVTTRCPYRAFYALTTSHLLICTSFT